MRPESIAATKAVADLLSHSSIAITRAAVDGLAELLGLGPA